MTGWKDWQIGEVVTESDFQSFVQDQVVQRYADASARTSALGTAVAEGMVSYLQDTNKVEVYDGSSWVQVGQEGDITSVTAGTGLTGGGTAGDVTLNADYAAIGSAVSITASQVTDLTASAAAINTIDDGTAGYTALSNGTAGITYQPVSHNYIINGAFDIWQRGTTGSAGGYVADRFLAAGNLSTRVQSQQSFTPAEILANGFGDARFYYRCVNTSVPDPAAFTSVNQRIEDVRTLAGQQVTISYYAKADAAKSVVVELQQNFGSGGSPVVNTFVAKQALTTSWARYSHTFTVPSTSGKTIASVSWADIRWFLDAGSNFDARTDSLGQQDITFDFWGVQLEAGSVATPFKRHAPSLQGELAACQRYYQRVTAGGAYGLVTQMGNATSTTNARVPLDLKVPLRVTATSFEASNVGLNDGANVIVPSAYALASDNASVQYLNCTATGLTQFRPYNLSGNNNSAAFVAVSAEL